MKNVILPIVLLAGGWWLTGCEDITFDPNLTGSITGKVVQGDLSSPVSGVIITTSPSTRIVLTDTLGNFSLDSIPIGSYTIRASKDGFVDKIENVNLDADGKQQVTIVLEEELILEGSNQPPVAPSNPAPAHEADSVELSVTLSWSGSDPDNPSDLTYDVFLIDNKGNVSSQIGANLTDTSLLVNNLDYSNTYYWQVVARDGLAEPVFGPVWSFRTLPFPDYPIHFVRKVNGNLVLFAGEAPPEDLTRLRENNGEVVVLASAQLTSVEENCWRPRLSPLGNRIAFLSRVGGQTHLFTMNRDGSDRRQVTSEIPVAGFDEEELDFTWSPTGDRLLYMNFDRLFSINRDGSGRTLLATAPEGWAFAEVSWSKETIGLRIRRNDPYLSSIIMLDPLGNDPPDTLINQENGQLAGRIGGPFLSPVVNTFLYSFDITGSTNSPAGAQVNAHILERATDGSGSVFDLSAVEKGTAIDGFNDLDPIYGPRGARVVFVRRLNDNSSIGDIYIMETNGDNRVRMFANAMMPDW